MRIFVLTTGRSGSLTFARACEHITNFTSGHETRSHLHGAARFGYPDQHIEVDNRLSWVLGSLGRHTTDDRFVHLVRDPEAVARSFARRLELEPPTTSTMAKRAVRGAVPAPLGQSIITAFAHTIINGPSPAPEEALDICRFYVDVVTDNITAFLRERDHVTVHLGSDADFEAFWTWAEAEGDLSGALGDWGIRHNRSRA